MDGVLAPLLKLAIGFGAIIAALVIPFRMTGFVGSALARLGKMGIGSGRVGLAGLLGYGAKATGKKKLFGRSVGKGFQNVRDLLYVPEKFMESRGRLESRIKAEAGAGTHFMFRQQQAGDEEYNHLIGEVRKEFQGKAAGEKLDGIIDAAKKGDTFRRIAAVGAVYSEADRANFFNEIRGRLETYDKAIKEGKPEEKKAAMEKRKELIEGLGFNENEAGSFDNSEVFYKDGDAIKIKDTNMAKALLSVRAAGGKYTAIKKQVKDANGNVKEVNDGYQLDDSDHLQQFIGRQRQIWDKDNKKNGWHGESFTAKTDAKGKMRIVSEDEMNMVGAGNFQDNDVQRAMHSMNISDLTQRDEKGNRIINEHMLTAFKNGHLEHLNRLSAEAENGLQELFADLYEESTDAAGIVTSTMVATGVDRFNNEMERLKAIVNKRTDLNSTQRARLLDEQTKRWSVLYAAYRPGGDKKAAENLVLKLPSIQAGQSAKDILGQLDGNFKTAAKGADANAII